MDVGENSHWVSITFPTLPIPSFLFILKYSIPEDLSPTMALTLTVQKNYLNTLPQFSSYLQTCAWNHIFSLFFLFGFFFSFSRIAFPLHSQLYPPLIICPISYFSSFIIPLPTKRLTFFFILKNKQNPTTNQWFLSILNCSLKLLIYLSPSHYHKTSQNNLVHLLRAFSNPLLSSLDPLKFCAGIFTPYTGSHSPSSSRTDNQYFSLGFLSL